MKAKGNSEYEDMNIGNVASTQRKAYKKKLKK